MLAKLRRRGATNLLRTQVPVRTAWEALKRERKARLRAEVAGLNPLAARAEVDRRRRQIEAVRRRGET